MVTLSKNCILLLFQIHGYIIEDLHSLTVSSFKMLDGVNSRIGFHFSNGMVTIGKSDLRVTIF